MADITIDDEIGAVRNHIDRCNVLVMESEDRTDHFARERDIFASVLRRLERMQVERRPPPDSPPDREGRE